MCSITLNPIQPLRTAQQGLHSRYLAAIGTGEARRSCLGFLSLLFAIILPLSLSGAGLPLSVFPGALLAAGESPVSGHKGRRPRMCGPHADLCPCKANHVSAPRPEPVIRMQHIGAHEPSARFYIFCGRAASCHVKASPFSVSP